MKHFSHFFYFLTRRNACGCVLLFPRRAGSTQPVLAHLKPSDLSEIVILNVGYVVECAVQNTPGGKCVGAANVRMCTALGGQHRAT